MQTCRYGVSYEISSKQISKKVIFLHSMCVFSCFFSRFAGMNAFLDDFLVVFTVVWPLVWLLEPPPFLKALQGTHHGYVNLHMHTISLCVMGSPYANFSAICAHLHTGIPICIRQSPYAKLRIWGYKTKFPVCAQLQYAYGE